MRLFHNAAAAVFSLFASVAALAQSPQEAYIERYARTAVDEMYRSGVPASITLAQGLLESRYGLSSLAADGNNHFGIKCHDWKGKKQYADDDRRKECFRKYDAAEESFRDHSDFLRYRDRYKFLFEYKTEDYKSWAYGLKKAGYATDPAYPSKLIKLIEDYDLSRFDKLTPSQVEKSVGKADAGGKKADALPAKGNRREEKAEKKKNKAEAKKRGRSGDKTSASAVAIPESPLSLEEPKKIEPEGRESYTFSLSRRMRSLNGVPFIYAADGETIESIARANDLFVRELRKFNDMLPGQEPEAGDIIYLQQKKKKAAKGLEKYISDDGGETLRELSQRFAVRLQDLEKLNSLPAGYVLQADDVIALR